MRRFINGHDVVQVWSETMHEHQEALKVYRSRGWELVTPEPKFINAAEVPFRSTVRRKLTTRDDER